MTNKFRWVSGKNCFGFYDLYTVNVECCSVDSIKGLNDYFFIQYANTDF